MIMTNYNDLACDLFNGILECNADMKDFIHAVQIQFAILRIYKTNRRMFALFPTTFVQNIFKGIHQEKHKFLKLKLRRKNFLTIPDILFATDSTFSKIRSLRKRQTLRIFFQDSLLFPPPFLPLQVWES